MRIKSTLPYVAALGGAAVLALAAAVLSVSAIERSTDRALRIAMEEGGHGWAKVKVDGLQVALSGTAPNEATRFRALSVAGTIVDAARVIDNMQIKATEQVTAPKFSVEILRNDDGISLIGLMPAATNREAMLARISRATGGAPVADLIDTADYPAPAGWDKAIDYGLDALALLPRSKISVSADEVDITAISDSAKQKSDFESKLAAARPESIGGTTEISAPRPVITPFTLRFLIDEAGGPRFDACSAGSEEGLASIRAAAADAGLTGDDNCIVGLGIPSPRWPEAVSLGIAALKDLGGGSITFSDADVSLVAQPGVEQETFDRVVGELENALPDVFSLHSVRPEPEEPVDGATAGPPQFSMTLSPEGRVQMRGRVADDRARTAAESFARARFGSDKVYGAMRLDEALPDGWSTRVLAAIEVLSLLDNGMVLAQPDSLEIRGQTGSQGTKAEIARILSEKLGDGRSFKIDVTYVRKLDPQLDIPTPKQCVERVNAILASSKINFEPGSSDLNDEGAETLDRIAEQLKDCSDVPMEIGGHTDSQGREEMNAALSQARADAVLNGLLARRVLTSSLTSHGYGESQPIADNDTEEGRETNRRIEFTLLMDDEGTKGDAADAEADTDATDAPQATDETKAPNE